MTYRNGAKSRKWVNFSGKWGKYSAVSGDENKINILFINFECRKIWGDFCAELTKCDRLVTMR